MPRAFLAVLRFCLNAWVGVAIFFVIVLLELRHSALFDNTAKFQHPLVLFPLYYGFEFSLLGAALVSAFGGLWNATMGVIRRLALPALVGITLGMATLDYTLVYRRLAAMMAAKEFPAAQFVMLHQRSRLINEFVLGLSIVAAIVALWPERSQKPEHGTPG